MIEQQRGVRQNRPTYVVAFDLLSIATVENSEVPESITGGRPLSGVPLESRIFSREETKL